MYYIDYNDREKTYKYKNRLYRKLKDIQIDLHNNKYIKYESKKDIIVNNYKLDQEQKEAIISDEINTLVIAAAGSGKSLTIIGKINYLIKKGISPKDILCISFTNDACDNLKSKLNYDVSVLTFHKLALSIIGYHTYDIIPSNTLEYIIDEYFNSVIYNNKDMINKVISLSIKKTTYKTFINSKHYISLKQTIKTFINLYKANDYTLERFCQIDDMRYHTLLSIIVDVYLLYQKELKDNCSIDFDDMISLATKKVLNDEINQSYKYIIIDEFQDTSLVKLNLIKAIINKTGAKLFVVGDDYQSIYKFTGCDLDIFLNFSKYVGFSRLVKLTYTYRNSQQLINCSTKFIRKNRHQISKKIKSGKKRLKPIKIINYKSNVLESLIKYLISISEDNILILGRNNNDINKYLNSSFIMNNDNIKYKNNNICIRYLTVHRSKGLEADCVILINLYDDLLGFPCKLKEADILSLINKEDKYPFEEERRLFYVALTRTKKDIYLICPYNVSVFVKEIINDNKQDIEYLTI